MLGVWPVFKILANIDLQTAGLIACFGLLVGEGSQIFFGFFCARGASQKGLMAFGILMTGSIIALSYTENSIFLFVLMLMTYIGAGAFHPAAAGMVGQWSLKRKGLFLTIFSSGGMVGAAISQVTFTKSYYLFNAQPLPLLLPLLSIFVWMVFHSFPESQKKFKSASLKKILGWLIPKRKEILILFLTQVCMQAIMLGFVFLLPDVLSLRGYESWFCLGGAHCAFVMGAAVMSIPAGYLVDRYHYRNVLVTTILISLVGFYFFLIAGTFSIPITALLLFGMGGCMGVVNPVIVAAGNTLVSNEASSFISALFMGGATSIGSIGLAFSGFAASYFTQEPAIQALELLGICFAFIIFLLFQLTTSSQLENEQFIRIPMYN